VEFHHLQCFAAVADELHFGRAAQRLQLTPSPVSRAVRELEHELGGELFVRRYHQVELTRLGAEVLPHARRVLEETDQLRAAARACASSVPRSMRLGVSTLCPPDASEAVVTLLEGSPGHPRVEVDLATTARLLPKLEGGDLDLALVQLPLGRPHLSSLVLAQYDVLVVMRRQDPLAGHDRLSLSQLAGRTLTLGSPHVEPVAMATMIANLRAHGVLDLVQMDEFDHLKIAAKIRRDGGLAFTLHPDTGGSARIFDDSAFRLVPLTDEGFKFSLGAAWRTSATDRDPVMAEVVELLRTRWSAPLAMRSPVPSDRGPRIRPATGAQDERPRST
jgi:DNA-binding transcriptional LysR family regulator